ncbi:MAG: hypothetical protein ACYCZX_16405 [Rhodospirillaceae bacterium]
MRSAIGALGIFLVCLNMGLGPVAAAAGLHDLYIQAAAAGEKCTGQPLTALQTAGLAAVINAAGHGPATPQDVVAALETARAAAHKLNCDDLYMQIHLQFFQRTILPKLQSVDAASPAPASAGV